MRLFFIEWCGKNFGLTDAVKELRSRGNEVVYWSGYDLDAHVDKKDFSETIFHDYFDARAGRPSPQVDDSSFPPPSEALINKMFATETLLLVMMEKAYEWMGVNQKKHLYFQYLRYWDGIIKKYKPDALIGPNAPHTVYDLVLFDLAKLYGIKTIIFEQTSINDRSIVMNDFRFGCEALRSQLSKDHGVTYSVNDFEPDIKRYWDKQMNPDIKPTPLIVKQTLARYSPGKILKIKVKAVANSFRDGHFIERLSHRLLRVGKSTMPKEYAKCVSQVDFSKKYVYAPLHYQPECTTSPLGGIFVDQLLMIETLSHTFPEGWLLYVKEHPFQWKPRGSSYFSFRYEGFYKAIARLPNVRLVPVETDTFKLLEHATAVASVGGTAPWEGALRGKPGIVFGYPWYRGCDGIFVVRSAAQCSEALDKIKNGFTVDRQTMINFLGSFQKAVLNCFRDSYNQKLSSLTIQQNIQNIVQLISREITV